jgi:hypothetical protein
MPTKNFGVDTVKSISITDTSRASGLLLLSKDTTAMYVYGDTMHMFTTSKAWKFTPKILSDTVNINYLLTNCPKPNRNELLIVTPNAQATTTACDTIPYIYFDTIRYGVDMSGLYIPLAGTDTPNIVTGSIEFLPFVNSYLFSQDTTTNSIGILDLGYDLGASGSAIIALNDSAESIFTFGVQSFDINSNNPIFEGLKGNSYYNANLQDESYIQKKYVDDNFTANSSILSDTATLDFASIPAQLFEGLTVTVTGASVGDVVAIGIPTAAAVPSSMFTAFVSATDTVTIRAANISLISIDPASGLFKVKVFKD